jgi:hypothetical protein
MRGVVENLRHGYRLRHAAMLVPAFLLPLALLGVTIEPALRVATGRRELSRAQEMVERARRARSVLEEVGPIEQIAPLEEMRQELYALVPDSISAVEVYSRVRQVAAGCGFAVDSIVLGAAEDLELVHDDDTIVMQEIQVAGTATVDAVLGLVRSLRRSGLPLAVVGVRLQRTSLHGDEFSVDLRLGTFHHAPATRNTDSEEGSS